MKNLKVKIPIVIVVSLLHFLVLEFSPSLRGIEMLFTALFTVLFYFIIIQTVYDIWFLFKNQEYKKLLLSLVPCLLVISILIAVDSDPKTISYLLFYELLIGISLFYWAFKYLLKFLNLFGPKTIV